MKRLLVCIIFGQLLLSSCNKTAKPTKRTFDSTGKETKECRIRNADGSGPYILLGRYNESRCNKKISALCSQSRYKQTHRDKGYFARGKFGNTIMIGTCP